MASPHDLDRAAARVARSEGALDLAIGETLDLIFRCDRLMRLGYSSERDYARERLGAPVRTMRGWLALARACAGRPLLREAVAKGLVSPCKARAITLAAAEDEPSWTAFAMTATLREVEAAVREVGKEPPPEFRAESFVVKMSPEQQDRLDAALALARHMLGGTPPEWQCLDLVVTEWLSEHGGWTPEKRAAPRPEARRRLPGMACAGPLAAITGTDAVVTAEPPGTENPGDLDTRVLRLTAARQRFDLTLGALALRIVEGRVWTAVGYGSFQAYCSLRLGMSEQAVRERVWFERRMFALPGLREAMTSGRLTHAKALLVAREAGPRTVAELIGRAVKTTWQQADREAQARESQRNRACGIRRLWGRG